MAARQYSGGCHCGLVRYEVTADLDRTITCNCSRCAKLGVILAFAPAQSFTLKSGETALTDYQFNKKMIHHLLCPTCGIESFARGTAPDGKQMVAINVRCLEGVDVASLSPLPFNGRDM
jgi:hypothetical protein